MKNKIVTVEFYARKSRVSKTVVYNRIKKGKIIARKIKVAGYTTTVIDLAKFPITGKEKRGRKKLNDLSIKELRDLS